VKWSVQSGDAFEVTALKLGLEFVIKGHRRVVGFKFERATSSWAISRKNPTLKFANWA
jgi:hypothetical protein